MDIYDDPHIRAVREARRRVERGDPVEHVAAPRPSPPPPQTMSGPDVLFVAKFIAGAVWGIICIALFLSSPGVGTAGAAVGLFLAGVLTKRSSAIQRW